MSPMLIFPAVFHGLLPHNWQTVSKTRATSGGNFRRFYIPSSASRPARYAWDVEEVVAWAERVLRPWSPESSDRLRALAQHQDALR